MAISPPHNWLQRDLVSRRHMIHATPHSGGLNWETVLKLKHLRQTFMSHIKLCFDIKFCLIYLFLCGYWVWNTAVIFFSSEPCYYIPTVNFQSHLYNISSLGGRFKKEIVVDGQSYLLLIRDEGGPPELQVGGQILQNASLFWSCNTYRAETLCILSCRPKLFETDHGSPTGLLGEVWQWPWGWSTKRKMCQITTGKIILWPNGQKWINRYEYLKYIFKKQFLLSWALIFSREKRLFLYWFHFQISHQTSIFE